MSAHDFDLPRAAVRRSFNVASPRYDAHAALQTRVRELLLERITAGAPRVVLDAGAGTGHASRALQRRFRGATVVALDFAESMLHVARRQQGWLRRFARVCADLERLPLASATADLAFCNLTLQWLTEPDRALAEFARVLRPGGWLYFTSFGPGTLGELRDAWAAVDGYTHVNRFIDMHDLGEAVGRNGFEDPVLDVERFTLTYGDLRALMQDLKGIGAHNVTAGRPRGLTGRRRLAQLTAAYDQLRVDGRLPATYEVIFGRARAAVRESRTGPAEVRIPISQIARRP
ncbi:MAG TPA: malonyl-ACP O-methyltransferase BioC [Steroidobacteraceae bacterium]|nr:malonyl-ACP O-methyltransferase BioC [Steroidobacteraceae bacterium]